MHRFDWNLNYKFQNYIELTKEIVVNICKQLVACSLFLYLVGPTLSLSKPPKHVNRDVFFDRNVIANYLSANNIFTDNLSATNNATINGSLRVNGTIINNGTPVPTELAGDVTGPLTANTVQTVGGRAITNLDAPNTLVSRNGSGNFAANMITIDGSVTNSTDAATKAYVDSSAGLVIKTPALVASISDKPISGLYSIDGVMLASNDRVLLVGQSDAKQNGLWQARLGSWVRPSDFVSGEEAGKAYVLVTAGTVYSGASWVCSTPSAIIDTNDILFVQFSLPDQTTGANVGGMPGQFFRDKTGKILNFKTLATDSHLSVANNPNDVTVTTDATSLNVPSTMVARDPAGFFSGSGVRFDNGAGFVAMGAPVSIPANYSFSLPSHPPISGQVLKTTSVSTTTWAPMSPSPLATKSYYVSQAGNDSNDGSLLAPFATLKHAIIVANDLPASVTNPVCINIGAGVFVEMNSGAPLLISTDGISIVGASCESTIIVPASGSNDLLSIAAGNVEIDNLTFNALPGSTACAVNQVAPLTESMQFATYKNLGINAFQTGFIINGSEILSCQFINIRALTNGTAINCANTYLTVLGSLIVGNYDVDNMPVGTGLILSGASSIAEISNTVFESLNLGVSVSNNGSYSFDGCIFYSSKICASCSGGTLSKFANASFCFNLPSSVNITASDSGTVVNVIGCLLSGQDVTGLNRYGIGMLATTGATIYADSSAIEMEAVGIQSGTTGDTSATFVRALSVGITDCVTDINQVGSSSLQFIGGTCNEEYVYIADPTYVNFSSFHSNGESILSIGSNADTNYKLYQVLNGQSPMPNLHYTPTYYGYKGTIYQSADDDTAINATQSNASDAANFVVTGDKTKQASIGLISEPVANIGSGAYVRGWSMTKMGTQADLAFTYTNNDSGLDPRLNTVMNLNGYSNQIELPATTNPTNASAKFVWAGDTTLYRSDVNKLKTDGNVTIGGLAPTAGVVHNDSTGLLSSSLIVNNDISGIASIADTKLATIQTPGKVSNSATTATPTNTHDTIVSRDSNGDVWLNTVHAIAANITTITGTLYGNATTANSATTAAGFSGTLSGEVQGGQSSTQVVNIRGQTAANIAAATVAANAATRDSSAGTIVMRDGSKSFAAGTITADQFNGPVTGNVTGSLSGNATSATYATTAGSATNFTGLLSGNVTGSQNLTVVSSVGGQSAANVAAATSAVLTATSNNAANTIVLRNSSGNFSTYQITIGGPISNANDVTTKAYVDAAVASGFTVKDPALVVSLAPVALIGLQIIDGVILAAGNRVLLVGQIDSKENGLWLVSGEGWSRALDFAVGMTAHSAYVLTTSGDTQAGSGWVCTTPTAIIGTDSIAFVLFSMPGQTTAANVGAGDGQLFRDKTGQTLNFKTIAAGIHMAITNNADDVTLATDASSANTPGVSTIIARDVSGNFSAGTMTGAASLNVLKAGDTMTGGLTMANRSQVDFQDVGGVNYVGLRAPLAVSANYSVDLPPAAPAAGQVLQATSASTTTWATIGQPPAAAKTYYVSLAGNDTTGDGSLLNPYRTLGHALVAANGVASLPNNPVVISVGAGDFIENPLTISAEGISIIGSAMQSTNIIPLNSAANLFHITANNVQISNLSLTASDTSTPCAINQATTGEGSVYYNNILVLFFQTGFSISASGHSPTFMLNSVQGIGNGTFFTSNNASVIINASNVAGVMDGSPANTGMVFTGTNGLAQVFSTVFYKLNTGVSTSGGGAYSFDSCTFEQTINGAILSGGAVNKLTALTFAHNYEASINVAAADPNTKVYLTGCTFDGQDTEVSPQPHGLAIKATTGATILASSSSIEMNVVGIQTGTTGDTSSTYIRALSVGLSACTTDINQFGSSTLQFVGGTCNEERINIENPTNVNFAAFHSNGQSILSIGPGSDSPYTLLQVVNGQPAGYMPNMSYSPNYYGYKGIVFKDSNAYATFNATEANSNNAAYYVVTDDRTKAANISLLSDQGGSNNGSNVRGWEMSKTGTLADLSFTYSNNDTFGLASRLNTVMNLDGNSNKINFPATTNPTNVTAQLVWGADTTLYRNAANSLKTDGNVIVGGLAPTPGVVHNTSTGLLTSFLITNTDISGSAGITDDKLATISTHGKVSNSATTGDPTATPSTLALRDSSGDIWFHNINANAATITTVTVSGTLYGTATNATNATTAGSFSGSLGGDVTGHQGSTVVGSVGNGSMSAATIVTDCNLVGAATDQPTGSAIVRRDGAGSFSAGSITLASSGNLNFGSASTAISCGSGTLNFTAGSSNNMSISDAAITTAAPFLLTNVLCNQAAMTVVPSEAVNSIHCNSNTGILILQHTTSIGGFTIYFPPFPTDGQYFTILCGSPFSISITNRPGIDGASIVNPITMLVPGSRLDGNSGGCSVTYYYLAASNSWYCCSRG